MTSPAFKAWEIIKALAVPLALGLGLFVWQSNARMSNIETALDHLDRDITRLETKFNDYRGRVIRLKETTLEFEGRISTVQQSLQDVTDRLNRITDIITKDLKLMPPLRSAIPPESNLLQIPIPTSLRDGFRDEVE